MSAAEGDETRARLWRLLGAVFLPSWILGGGVWLLGLSWGGLVAVGVGILYMWGPGVACILLARRWYPGEAKGALGLSLKANLFWVLGWCVWPALAVVVLGVTLLAPDVQLDWSLDSLLTRYAEALTPEQLAQAKESLDALPVHPVLLALPQALIAGASINLAAALGEELCWRGLLHHLTRPWGFWRQALFVGAVWGLWHAPLILQGHNYPEHRVVGVGMMVLFCAGLAGPLAWLRNRGGSVVVAGLAHGTLNASAGVPLLVIAGGSDLWNGLTGGAGLLVLGLWNLLLWGASRRWGESFLTGAAA